MKKMAVSQIKLYCIKITVGFFFRKIGQCQIEGLVLLTSAQMKYTAVGIFQQNGKDLE